MSSMKESKKAIINALKNDTKHGGKFEALVLNLALQKIDSDSFEFDGEAVYTVDRQCIIYCLSQKDSFSIPEGVEVIGEMAFRSKKNLKNVIIPNTVTSIEKDAFYDCDRLDNVFIPAGVKNIDGYAFAECDALKQVTFEGTPAHLNRHTFSDSDNLRKLVVPKGSVKAFQKALKYDGSEDEYLILESLTSNPSPNSLTPNPSPKGEGSEKPQAVEKAEDKAPKAEDKAPKAKKNKKNK